MSSDAFQKCLLGESKRSKYSIVLSDRMASILESVFHHLNTISDNLENGNSITSNDINSTFQYLTVLMTCSGLMRKVSINMNIDNK